MKIRLVEDTTILREFETNNDGDIERYDYSYKPITKYRIEVEKENTYGFLGRKTKTYWTCLYLSHNKEEMEKVFNWIKENKSLRTEDVLDTCEINE